MSVHRSHSWKKFLTSLRASDQQRIQPAILDFVESPQSPSHLSPSQKKEIEESINITGFNRPNIHTLLFSATAFLLLMLVLIFTSLNIYMTDSSPRQSESESANTIIKETMEKEFVILNDRLTRIETALENLSIGEPEPTPSEQNLGPPDFWNAKPLIMAPLKISSWGDLSKPLKIKPASDGIHIRTEPNTNQESLENGLRNFKDPFTFKAQKIVNVNNEFFFAEISNCSITDLNEKWVYILKKNSGDQWVPNFTIEPRD